MFFQPMTLLAARSATMKSAIFTVFFLITLFLSQQPFVYTQTDTGIVTGRVVKDDKSTPVGDALIRCKQKDGTRKCNPPRSEDDGNFRITATPLGGLSVTAKKYLNNKTIVLFGSTEVYAVPDEHRGVEPPFIVTVGPLTHASLPRRPYASGAATIVLSAFPLTVPVAQADSQSSKSKQVNSSPSISGTISVTETADPVRVRVIFSDDDTDAVIDETLLHLSGYATTGSFTFPITKIGQYTLAVLAEGYRAVNFLIIKQSAVEIPTAGGTVRPIALLVLKSDGTVVGNPSLMEIKLEPLAAQKAEGLRELINRDEATRRSVFPPLLMQSLPVP